MNSFQRFLYNSHRATTRGKRGESVSNPGQAGLRFGLPDHLTRGGQATVKQICYCGLVVKQVPSHWLQSGQARHLRGQARNLVRRRAYVEKIRLRRIFSEGASPLDPRLEKH